MPVLDDLVADTLAAYAEQVRAPDIAPQVIRRIRRQNRHRAAGSLTIVAVAAALASWTVSQVTSADHPQIAPAAGPLIASGECAGLSVLVGGPNPGPVDATNPGEPRNAQTIGPEITTVVMGRQDHLWFTATGPCVEQLVLLPSGSVVSGLAGPGFVPFARSGEAIVHATTDRDVTEDLELILRRGCDVPDCQPIATIRVDVTDTAPAKDTGQQTRRTAPPTPAP